MIISIPEYWNYFKLGYVMNSYSFIIYFFFVSELLESKKRSMSPIEKDKDYKKGAVNNIFIIYVSQISFENKMSV